MRLRKLTVDGYRNLSTAELFPVENVNVFCGANAQGKTNLLEALWMFTGRRSFRGARDRELVRFGCSSADLSAQFEEEGRAVAVRLHIDTKRTAKRDGVLLESTAALAEIFPCMLFSPEDLALVKEGPAQRRRFLDDAISALRPRYTAALSEYQRALGQRNTLLRDIPRHPELRDMLPLFEDAMAKTGEVIIKHRRQYEMALAESAAAVYAGFSGDTERMEVAYRSSFDGDDIRERISDALCSSLEDDLRAGFTTVGPHRDDLAVVIEGKEARRFASQGQQRSAAIALKLAEAEILSRGFGETPVALLDDVLSELDGYRQDYILHRMGNWQIFLTCCDASIAKRLQDGRVFFLEKGELRNDCPPWPGDDGASG